MFELVTLSSKNFRVDCDDRQSIIDVSVAHCSVVACNSSADAFHFLNDVCEILLCRIPRVAELKLIPVQAGWNIYVKPGMDSVTSTTWQTMVSMTQQTAPTTAADSVEGDLPLPVWAIAVIVVVGVLTVAGIAVAVACCRRRRQQPQAEVGSHTYINQNRPQNLAQVNTPHRRVTEPDDDDTGYEKIHMNTRP